MKRAIKSIPIVGALAVCAYRSLKRKSIKIESSKQFWKERYATGGNSGLGSYNKLAEFKAQIINDFVREKGVTSVIEYGCGDGNQLALSEYPSYIGFDVSETAVELCRKLFKEDQTKRFSLLEHYSGQVADLTLSLDVIYHLLEDETFNDYMAKLFDTALRYVVIYSSNTNETVSPAAAHVKHRKFTDWIEANRPEWVLMRHIPNKYPYRGRDEDGSFADFFVYSK